MDAARPNLVLPGPIRQNGYVVRDLDRAMDSWLRVGVGPWLVLRELKQAGSRYRGQPAEPVVSIAFANSGELQVELIAQLDDSASVYQEFLDSGREGFHHLAWWVEDFDGAARGADEAEWPVVYSGNVGGMAEFAYYDLGAVTGMVVEVMELTPATRWLGEAVRAAATDWDGSDPIRPLA